MEDKAKQPNMDWNEFLKVPSKLLKYIKSMLEMNPDKRRNNALSGKTKNLLKNEYVKYKKILKKQKDDRSRELNKVQSLKYEYKFYLIYIGNDLTQIKKSLHLNVLL